MSDFGKPCYIIVSPARWRLEEAMSMSNRVQWISLDTGIIIDDPGPETSDTRITDADIASAQVKVAAIFGPGVRVYADYRSFRFTYPGESLSLGSLVALSEAFGTDRINVEPGRCTFGGSDYTPADYSETEIVILVKP